MATQKVRPDLDSDEGQESYLRRAKRSRMLDALAIVAGIVIVAAIGVQVVFVASDPAGPDTGAEPAHVGPAERGGENRESQPSLEPALIGNVTQSGAGCALETVADPILPGAGRLSLVNETNRRVSFELFRFDPDVLTFTQFEQDVAHNQYRHPYSESGWGLALLVQREVGRGASGTITDSFTTGDDFAVVCLHKHPLPQPLPQHAPGEAFALVGPIVVP